MQSVLGKDSEKHEEKDHLNAHDGSWWEAKEIIGERKNEYKVSWAGIDPATGKTYKPCWVRKSDCTEELLNTWIKSDKQRKTKKSANLAKKKASQGESIQKNKRKKINNDFNDEHSSNVPEKKHKGAFKNVCNDHSNHWNILNIFLRYLILLILFVRIHWETCHASPIKNCLTSSSNMNAQTKGETLDAAINDISMNRIFNFSEFPKKDTVSSIYHITNDNNIKFPNFQTDMFSKSDSIFNDNISNISANKHEDQADGNNEIIVFKGEKSDKEVSLKDIQYDEISVNYASQQLKSLPPSEKVSTWLSHNESMQLEIFDDIRSQISTSTINIHRDQLNCTEYDCSAMCVPVDSEFLSETEKDNVSLESGISGEKMSGKYDSDVSASYTCDNFLVSFRSIRNRSHVYFFGIEMNRIQREMYLQLILQYNDLIQEFCSLSNPDKALVKKELLEILLQKLNISYLKINQYFENPNINETTRVLLIAHGRGKGNDVKLYCNLVICIYTSIHILSVCDLNQDDEMKDHIIPVTINSIEHIQLSIIKDIPQNLYFQNVAKITILLRKFAGILPSNQFFSNESAQLVYNWVQGNCKDRWMLPIISDLKELTITLSHKDNRLISEMQLNNLIELEEKISQHDNYLYDELYQETQEASSIAIKSDSFDSSDKKILENLSSQFEIAHLQTNADNFVVNDQLDYLTLNLETIQEPNLNNKVPNNVKTEHDPLYTEINVLRSSLHKIQGELKSTENELSSFKIASDRLQKRYEEMQEQYRNLKLEYESIVDIKDRLQKRLNDFQENYKRVNENGSLFLQTEQLKDTFSNSKQEKTFDVMNDLEKTYFEENLRLKKIIENKMSDFEFLRLQYQEASSSAANLANEVKELEAENVRLKNKAEGEAMQLKGMMIKLLEKKMSERIEELEIQNSLYLKQLKLKEKDETRQLCAHDRLRVSNVP
ncbi:hypothetical protein PORY_000181 [Pneumocystis oryctolagi]|uniref:Uncharacterized protein n=1 Tax=Pneumocystis oryctolagi TaxID=42067 RepID=A0ACB7CF16_9ASCO|nr:hypothetical protein PORY_000181 [Pneumocystis oryctolagi]